MLKFRVNVRVKGTLKAKCKRHPKYDPSLDDKLNTEPRCSVCADIRALQTARLALEEAARAFERRSYQWQMAELSKLQQRSQATPQRGYD